MTFEYENLVLLMLAITEKNKASQTYHECQGHCEIKLLILQMSH